MTTTLVEAGDGTDVVVVHEGIPPGVPIADNEMGTTDYAPRLRARLAVEQQLINDATSRGWAHDVDRHQATRARLE